MALTPLKVSAATVLSGTGLVSRLAARAGSTTQYRTVDNLSATTNPTVNDDTGDGYHAGSLWFRTDTGTAFICRDASAAAAVWIQTSNGLFSDYIATRYFWPRGYTPNTAAASGLDTIRFLPIIGLKRRVTISELGFRIGAGSGATNCQLALYAPDKTEGNPTGSALASTANQATTASSTNISVAFSGAATVTLEPNEGVCAWMAINCSSATPTFITAGANVASLYLNTVGTTSLSNMFTSTTNIMNSLSLAQTFGTWPDVTASSFTEVNASSCPFMFYKVSAVG